MEEIEDRNQGIVEGNEGTERAAAQRLDDATFEPRAYVEQSGDYAQSEAIQGNFTAVVENVVNQAVGQVGHLPIPIPDPAMESTGGVKGGGGDGVAITPINLPHEAEVASGGVKGGGGDGVAITPINLPHEAEVASGGVKGGGGDGVAITPINLPHEADAVSGGVKGPGGDPGAMRGSAPVPQPVPHIADGAPARGPIGPLSDAGTPGKIDPFTGEVKPPTGPGGLQSGDSGESGSQGRPSETVKETHAGRETPQTAGGIGQEGPIHVAQPEGQLDATQVAGMQNTDTPPRVGQSGGKSEGSNTPIKPQELNAGHIADQAMNPVGMGTHGFIGNTPAGELGVARGYGSKAPQQGMPGGPDTSGTGTGNKFSGDSHTSGGGAPVSGNGAGGKGDGEYFTFYNMNADGNMEKSDGVTDKGSGSCEAAADRMFSMGMDKGAAGGHGIGEVWCADGSSWSVMWGGGDVSMALYGKKWNSIDAGSPMPYTGGGDWGTEKPRDPGTIGGKTEEIRESGQFAPVVSKGGRSGGGGSNAGDEPNIWDDGHYYGGIFGGTGGPGAMDPGGLDYYTPDKVDNARANTRIKTNI